VHFAESLINVGDLLVALSFLVGVLHASRHFQTLLKEVQSRGGVPVLLVLNSDGLIDTDKVPRDFDGNRVETAFSSFLKSGFKIFFSFRSIVHFFLADTESLQGKCLALKKLELVADVQTALVEVTCSFKIIELLKIVRNSEVSFKTLFNFSVPLEGLAVNKRVFQSGQSGGRSVHNIPCALV